MSQQKPAPLRTDTLPLYAPIAETFGKVAIVTGPLSGLGRVCAITLAAHGYTVVLAGRGADRLEAAKGEIKTEAHKLQQKLLSAGGAEAAAAAAAAGPVPSSASSSTADGDSNNSSSNASSSCAPITSTVADPIAIPLDLSSFSSVIQFCDNFHALHLPLHVLLLNAGIAQHEFQCDETTKIEQTMLVNFVSHVLLTKLLLPTLMSSANSRIVHVSSGLHENHTFPKRDKYAVEDIRPLLQPTSNSFLQRYFGNYANSKLAQVVWMRWFHRRFPYQLTATAQSTVSEGSSAPIPSGIRVYAANPGLTTSSIRRSFSPTLGWILDHLPFGAGPTATEVGASTLIQCCIDPTFADKSGCYASRNAPKAPHPSADNESLQNALMEWTEGIIRKHVPQRYQTYEEIIEGAGNGNNNGAASSAAAAPATETATQ